MHMNIKRNHFSRERKDSEDMQKVEEERAKYKVLGLSGCVNMGNTCYLNSIIQCLSNTEILRAYFLSMTFYDDLKENVLFEMMKKSKSKDDIYEFKNKIINNKCTDTTSYKFYKLLKFMWEDISKVTPKSFKSILEKSNEEFAGFNQNDSHEALHLILDKIHEETGSPVQIHFTDMDKDMTNFNKMHKKCAETLEDDDVKIEEKEKIKNEYDKLKKTQPINYLNLLSHMHWKKNMSKKHSIITDLFTGLFSSNIKCLDCSHISSNFSSFHILTLPIKQSGTMDIDECLTEFTTQEKLDDYKCDECNKRNNTKIMNVWTFPEILIVHLNRFKIMGMMPNGEPDIHKIDTAVNFPLNDFCPKKIQFSAKKTDVKYDLYAVSEHIGSYRGGHYVAYCKNNINNKWYYYNDKNVIHIPDKDIETDINYSNAYILFYKRNHSKSMYDSDSDYSDVSDTE